MNDSVVNYRKIFSASLQKASQHNNIALTPKQPGLRLISIKTTDEFGKKIELTTRAVDLYSPFSIQYDTVISKMLWIELEHEFINDFDLNELLEVSISRDTYNSYSYFKADPQEINFHKYLFLDYDIKHAADVYIKATLSLEVVDKYQKQIYGTKVSIGLNDDGYLVNRGKGPFVDLDTEPLLSSIKVMIGPDQTSEFSLEGRRMSVDIPEGFECLVLYKPAHIEAGHFTPIDRNVSINANNELLLNERYADSIRYVLEVEMFNLNLTQTQATPVINSITVLSSDD